MKKVAIITGASSGMGKSTAQNLLQQGYKVYGAARRVERMKDLQDKGMEVVQMDLTKDESIVKAVNNMIKSNDNNQDKLTPVEVLGKEIAKAATVSNPKTRYLKGYLAKPLVRMKKWLGDKTFDKILLSQLK